MLHEANAQVGSGTEKVEWEGTKGYDAEVRRTVCSGILEK